MYTLNGWWFLSSGGSYPPVFMVDGYLETVVICRTAEKNKLYPYGWHLTQPPQQGSNRNLDMFDFLFL